MNEELKKKFESVWEAFIELEIKATFSEREIIMGGKSVSSFCGSVARYKRLFDKAVTEILMKDSNETT